jgi:hypothetical protein
MLDGREPALSLPKGRPSLRVHFPIWGWNCDNSALFLHLGALV